MYLQYPCHFCGKREGQVLHLGYWSCKPCAKTVKDHSACPEGQECKKEQPK